MTGIGLPRNTAAAVSVVLAPTIVAPLVIMFLEKDTYVRFYALQGLVGFVFYLILSLVLGYLPVARNFLSMLSGLITIVAFTLYLAMVYKAWLGDEWEVPVVGQIARMIFKKV